MKKVVSFNTKFINLRHTFLQSIHHDILCDMYHWCDYKSRCPYNVQHIFHCTPDHNIDLCTLFIKNCKLQCILSIILKKSCRKTNYLLLLQYSPIHPGVHPTQVPLMMLHLPSWQLSGHLLLQLLPYWPGVEQPFEVIRNILCISL